MRSTEAALCYALTRSHRAAPDETRRTG